MNKNCDYFREKLEEEVSRDLSAQERSAVDLHLDDCEDCRRCREALADDHRRLNALSTSMDMLGSRIEDGVMRTSSTTAKPLEITTVRWFNHPAARVAAAILVIAAIAFVSHFANRTTSPDVIWANVFRQVEQSTGFTARGKLELNGSSFDIILYESDEYGQKHEIYQSGTLLSRNFLDFARGTMISIQYDDSTYAQVSGPSEVRDESIFDVVAGMKESNHTSLGIAEIEGITTSGIEVADTVIFNGTQTIQTTRVYVDIETQWPVRIELDNEFGAGALNMTLENFMWHPVFKQSDFEPVIPDGFRSTYTFPDHGN